MVEPPPPELLYYTRPATVVFLQRLSRAVRGSWSVSSWYRDPAHNRSVGGDPSSQHLLGLAVDIVGDRWTLEDTELYARNAGLVPVPKGDHLHIQLFPAGWIRRQGYGWLFEV